MVFRRDAREGQEKATQRCCEVCASSLLSQPTHSADTIVETPNAMRMSGSLFKETLSSGARNQKQHPIFYTTAKRKHAACFKHKRFYFIHLISCVMEHIHSLHLPRMQKLTKFYMLCIKKYSAQYSCHSELKERCVP